MRKGLLLFLVCLTGNHYFSVGQITAGSVPSGTAVYNPNISLSLSNNYSDTTAYLDLDCDGINDVRVSLLKGNISLDTSNTASIYVLNPFDFCTTQILDYRIRYYNYGDTLCDVSNARWSSDTAYLIGCSAPVFYCPNYQSTVSSQYLAFKKIATGQIGWIRISFDLTASTVSLLIDEILALCSNPFVKEIYSQSNQLFSISSLNQSEITFTYSSSAIKREIIIHDITGKEMTRYSLPANSSSLQIKLPALAAGLYVARLEGNGAEGMVKFVIE